MTGEDPFGHDGGVLASLRYLDKARANATDVLREEGSNVDFLSVDGEEIALCHLSGLFLYTFGDGAPWRPPFEDTAAVALAAHHLNTGDGSIVPQVQGLNRECKVRFTVEFEDTEFSGGKTLSTIVEQVSREPTGPERKPCAFLGAYGSAISIPSSIVTGVFDYPQISGASTSAELDDSSQYPLFGRTIPSDQGNAIPFVRYMREVLDIQHLAVVNVNDAYGNAYVDGLRTAAQEHAPDMVFHQVPMDDDPSSIEAAVTSVANTKYRFIFAVVFTNPTHDALMTEAFRQGVAGTGEHTWLYGDSFSGTLDGRTFEKGSPVHLAYRGTGMLEVTGGVPGIPAFDNYVSKIANLHNPTDLEYISSHFPKYDHPDYESGPPFIDDPGFLMTITSGFSPFMYEATVALGLAACAASSKSEDGSFSGSDHFEQLVGASFTSLSGKVAFDPVSGTRDPTSALYKVTNYVEEEIQEDGKSMVRFNPVVTNLFEDSQWNQVEDFIFNDGTTVLPLDMPPPVQTSSDDINLAVLIGVPLAAALFLAVTIFLFYENKRKQNDTVWQVKKHELQFDDPPQVIGRGTFGLVLLAEYRGTMVAVKRVIPPDRKKKKKKNGTSSGTKPFVDTDPSGWSSSHAGTASAAGYNSRSTGITSWGGIGLGSRSLAGTVSGESRSNSTIVKSGMANRKKLAQDFIEEMRHLSKLRHPCITTVMGAVIGKGEEPMLVMEYMEHGSLYDLLHNETMVIEGELLLPILRDVSQGMRFLHCADPQVVHSDLKAANILVDNRYRAKVADFGLSQKKKGKKGAGTPFWMAPEILREESTNTAASDVYSFGIILFEVYSRRDPYEGERVKDVLRLVADKSVRKRPPVPKNMPTQVQSLMADCLQEEPEKRPTCEELDVRLKRIDARSVAPTQSPSKATSISLFDIFPRHIAEALRDGRPVEAEHRDLVTIFFSDIEGFTNLSSALEPRKVADMLDRLYTKFDELSHKHDIFKVETIGDAYMAVTNLVKDQSDHCKRIAEFAVDAVAAANKTLIDIDDPNLGTVSIRVGFHAGPVVADVVGTRNPRWCLFGDSVNIASRMESHSEVNRIHCSLAAAELLKVQCPEMPLNDRGEIRIKGKGEMHTFWVNETRMATKQEEPPMNVRQYLKDFLEETNKMEPVIEESNEFGTANRSGKLQEQQPPPKFDPKFDIEAPPPKLSAPAYTRLTL